MARPPPGSVILAAGGSARLGTPKGLLLAGGVPLVTRAAAAAAAAGCAPVVVVVGAEADAMEAALAGSGAVVVRNPDWPEGMASSIRCGVERLRQLAPEATAVLLATCDQPRVEAAHLRRLVGAFQQRGSGAAASAYGGTLGVPAVLGAELFPELLRLRGDRGARELLRESPSTVGVPCPEAEHDVDTPGDAARLLSGG